MYYVRILKGHKYLLNKTYYDKNNFRVNEELELTKEELINFIKSKGSISAKFEELKTLKKLPF